MDDQIIDQSALINEQPPVGMQMPEHMKERLAKRMELAKSKKDQKEKQKQAGENVSDIMVQKIYKAQIHNQQVRAIRNSRRDRFYDPEHVYDDDFESVQKTIMKDIALNEAEKLNQQRRQEQAAERRDRHLANKIQNAQASSSKHFIEPEVREAIKISTIQMNQEQKQEQAEARRKQLQEEKIQKAKEAQQKYFNEEAVHRDSSQQPQTKDFIDQTPEFKSQSVVRKPQQEPKTFHREQFNENSAAWTVRMKQPANFNQEDVLENQKVQVKNQAVAWNVQNEPANFNKQEELGSSLAQPEQQQQQQVTQNINVGLPMNIDMQVKKNVQEKQVMEINEQKTMIVGGNKLTFNIAITVNVEPIE